MTTRLKLRLDQRSFAAAARAVEAYSAVVVAKLDLLCARLAAIGVNTAVSVHDVPEQVRNGVYVAHEGDREWLVVSDDEAAFFVEFGTGAVGKEDPYRWEIPATFTWVYDLRLTPEAHWNLNPEWWFYNDSKGKVKMTRGRKPAGYMAQAAAAMRDRVIEVAKEVFG